ncbi:hypothetical protein ABKN59_006963 [Abortiporus biennis]
MANITVYPPDTYCSSSLQFGGGDTDFNACGLSVTNAMVNFLNLTSDMDTYFQAYCLNPPPDDSCPFGYCPNGDIAGPFIRWPTYITTFCLSVLIFYTPNDAQDAFWSQVLTVYSLIITCGSPLNAYLFFYSLISIWYTKHRMGGIVGHGQRIRRLIMIVGGLLWIALVIFVYRNATRSRFSQRSCEHLFPIENDIYVYPLSFYSTGLRTVGWFGFVLISPLALTAFMWLVAIVHQRHKIWRGDGFFYGFRRIWSKTGHKYPSTHFLLIILLPTIYWVSIIEFGCVNTADSQLSLSFGQVLAAFVAVPPVFSVIAVLKSRAAQWFFKWKLVRAIRGLKKQEPTLPITNEQISQTPSVDEDPEKNSDDSEKDGGKVDDHVEEVETTMPTLDMKPETKELAELDEEKR